MQRDIFKNLRVLSAVFFSAVFIVGAYLFAHGFESPQVVHASDETTLLHAMATKDSSGDGLPDWQKVLYGIPINATTTDYFNLGMTDGEAVARGLIIPKAIADIAVATSSPSGVNSIDNSLPPAPADGTLTAAFAQNFFSLYVSAKQAKGGAALSTSEINDIATQVINTLSTTIAKAPDFRSIADLTISSDSGAGAFRSFAINAEAVLAKNATKNATKSEIEYLKDALLSDDATAFPHMAAIAKTYRDSATGLSMLPVPTELAAYDLRLVNALMRVGEITTDFARATADPLAAILALQQYSQAVSDLNTSFTDIDTAYVRSGVTLPVGQPGASFVNFSKNLAEKQQAAAANI